MKQLIKDWRMRILFGLLMAGLVISYPKTSFAESDDWHFIGEEGLSTNGHIDISSNSLVVYNGVPYLVYADKDNDYKATVIKYENGSWEQVGNANFTSGGVIEPTLFIENGTPYIAYVGGDLTNYGTGKIQVGTKEGDTTNKTHVMKFDGENWVSVGVDGFVASIRPNSLSEESPSLYVDDGIPYLAYNSKTEEGVAVIKYVGIDANHPTGWEKVGTENVVKKASNNPSLYIDQGIPYVAFEDGAVYGRATVMKFDGSRWITVGNAGFSNDYPRAADFHGVNKPIITVEDGIPYIAYRDWEIKAKYFGGTAIIVKKFDGNNWTTFGKSDNTMEGTLKSFDVYKGVPYVAYTPAIAGLGDQLGVVKKYNGDDWQTVGLSDLVVNGVDMSLDVYNGIPYVAYEGRDIPLLRMLTKPAVKKMELNKLTSIEAIPESLELVKGEWTHIKIIAHYDNHSTGDVTSKAEIKMENPEIASLNDDIVKGLKFGKTAITASYGNMSVTVPLKVSKGNSAFTIQPMFQDAGNFKEGLARVYNDGKWEYIDISGNRVMKFQYDDARDFSEGLAAVYKDGRWSYIDKNGKKIIELSNKIGILGDFSEGLARIKKEDGKWEYIDKMGNVVINTNYNYVGDFKEGLALVEDNKQFGYIDKKGNEVIVPQYDFGGDFSEGLAWVNKNGYGGHGGPFGYIDRNGKEVTELQFDRVGDFHEGLAKVQKNNKWGYIDKNGTIIIDYKYSNAENFSEGLALVQSNNGCEFIDKTGKEAFAQHFISGESYSEGLAWVHIEDGKSNYIDKNGNVILEDLDYYYGSFSDGLVRTNLGGGDFGYVANPLLLGNLPNEVEEEQLEYPFSGYKNLGVFQNTAGNKIWTIKFNRQINKDSINNQSIYILDQYGEKVNRQVYISNNQKEVEVYPPSSFFKANQTYYLIVENTIRSQDGMPLGGATSVKFTIKKD